MEINRLNIAYDLLQTTKLSSNTVEITRENDEIQQRVSRVYFVICNSCYWCASYFGINDLSTSSTRALDCHVCNTHTELMPISSDDTFKTELAN
jgi:hypothetical protein